MYAMYLRKSRSDNIEESIEETLHQHETILFDLANKLKINPQNIVQFKEVGSGETIEARPEVKKLIDLVMQGVFEGVLVVDTQRLARGDTLDQGTIIRAFSLNNTKIITPQKTVDPQNEYDQEYFEFDLFMGRREYKMINRRMQRGRHIAVKEGYYIGSVAPYGYNRVKLDKSYSLTFNDSEMDIVRIVIDRYLEDWGASKIANELNTLGYLPRNCDRWTAPIIRTIIENIHLYCGYVKWNSRKTVTSYKDNQIVKTRPRNYDVEYYKGKHPVAFDENTLQAVLNKKKSKIVSKVPNNRKMQNPLSGIVVCADCGRKMVRRPYNSGRIETLICTTSQCKNISSDLYLVEKNIIQELEDTLLRYRTFNNKYDKIIGEDINRKKKAIKNLEKAKDKLNKQLDKACEMLEIGTYTVDLFKQRENALNIKIKANNDKILAINNEIENNTLERYKKATPYLEHALSLYWDATPKDKNKILKSIIERCHYKKFKSGRWDSKAVSSFDLDISLKL